MFVMTRILFAVIVVLTLSSCASAGSGSAERTAPKILSSTSQTAGGVLITDEMIGRSRGTMQLSRTATEPAYGYSEKLPIKVGGGFGSGSERTYQYLNTLRGPNGETVTYSRIGTCCPFKSPNSPFDGQALLEVYEIRQAGAAQARQLYFNWYDEGDVLVPLGLTAVK